MYLIISKPNGTLSFPSQTLPDVQFADAKRYPTLVRTLGSFVVLGKGVAEILREYQWRKYALVVHNNLGIILAIKARLFRISQNSIPLIWTKRCHLYRTSTPLRIFPSVFALLEC